MSIRGGVVYRLYLKETGDRSQETEGGGGVMEGAERLPV